MQLTNVTDDVANLALGPQRLIVRQRVDESEKFDDLDSSSSEVIVGPTAAIP